MSLVFVEQQACLRETIISERSGASVDIHYVVKKTPFVVVLRIAHSSLSFKSGHLKAELLYDVGRDSDVSREVIVPDGGPSLSFEAHASADGTECSVDLRLLVLTTQANGIRFVVRFTLAPKTGTTASLVAESQPICVVSKQQQIRNKEAEVMGEKDSQSVRSRKRVRTDDVFGVLQEILTMQRETLALVSAGRDAPAPAPSLRKSLAKKQEVKPELAPAPEPVFSRDLTVEEAMEALVVAYRREAVISGLQRPAKIRRVLEAQDVATQKELKEIGSLFLP